ncbi:catalase [Pseudoduganella flava]|uniref:Catalase n=1 Tax=Pseudoduganella flava TaxID=871742 RepID=A0A562PFZ0_9BURK|nr:catalase [Pseudoduganella flava]QGZ40184.1 catalase [Pseudoduganella flava]TWI43361.1 catalase [Pseudoduganella flava]
MGTDKHCGRLDGAGSILSTISGPSEGEPPKSLGQHTPESIRLLDKVEASQDLAADMPFNPTKPAEYGDDSVIPHEGAHETPSMPVATASTTTENIGSRKVGDGLPSIGHNPLNCPLDRVRVDDSGRELTTNQGVKVSNNQDTLKIGLRGPSALEDFIFREKITHFDHERIPERVVHARGSAAHGYFESYGDLSPLTRAALFSKAGKRTPVFVRFSTVVGSRGSADTVRDVRGFATKFYTEEGIWDLVGNNIPVFFIQDAMKFPDLIHAVKPEPHHEMPQASSAHDTFYDFAGLSPEIFHMLMWVESDRAIPRSYRMMQGFGVHTFRLVNAMGEAHFVKFHWTPMAGTHSLVWDEAVKLAGADPDFHRRDLWEAIEAGYFPEYELGMQVFTEQQAASFGVFDVLDPTKLVPEDLVPVRPVGRMVLDRNPDNFFAETEQVAFCAAHVVPGIDFTNDPLLQGRIHSYIDTQLTRLAGPNFHEIPINSPVAQVHNNQRDGFHRQAIHRGRVAYEPNSLAGGCPFQAGARGFVTFPAHEAGDKVRGKPELFGEHYGQARLFWHSQSPAEQRHIVNAYRFELTRVQTPAVRERIVAGLVNVDPALAQAVAADLGIPVPPPLPRATELPIPHYPPSPSLSLLARPGTLGIKTRRIALLVADGVDGAQVRHLYASLLKDGAQPRIVGQKLGAVQTLEHCPLEIEITLETGPSVLYDAAVLPAGSAASNKLAQDPRALEFIRDQYRHGKALLALGSGIELLDTARIPRTLPDGGADPGLIVDGDPHDALAAFKAAVARHRVWARETDPPRV